MERFAHTFNYENDTELEYTTEGNKDTIILRFTGEGDYGTDEAVCNSEPATGLRGLAYDLLSEISDFLDATGDGIYRTDEAIDSVISGRYWDDYANSTLYAFEHLLRALLTK